MITKHAIVLAIILGTASGALVTKQHTDTPKVPEQSSVGPPASAPIIVAQGRCFNGHCY